MNKFDKVISINKRRVNIEWMKRVFFWKDSKRRQFGDNSNLNPRQIFTYKIRIDNFGVPI